MSEKKTFPNIPVSHWLRLRKQFKKSIPGSITSNYIASVLGMTENSARTNILPSLRMIGMIDENGTTNQDMAVKFRDDERYKKLCAEILENNYPQDVRDAFPDSEADKDSIKTWFMNETGVGSSAAGRVAGFFVTLLEANPQAEISQKKPKQSKPQTKSTKVNPKIKKKSPKQKDSEARSSNPATGNKAPDLNINIQIHISSDATPDQIETIFESMSRHLYQNN